MLKYIPGDNEIPEGCANDVLEELSQLKNKMTVSSLEVHTSRKLLITT